MSPETVQIQADLCLPSCLVWCTKLEGSKQKSKALPDTEEQKQEGKQQDVGENQGSNRRHCHSFLPWHHSGKWSCPGEEQWGCVWEFVHEKLHQGGQWKSKGCTKVTTWETELNRCCNCRKQASIILRNCWLVDPKAVYITPCGVKETPNVTKWKLNIFWDIPVPQLVKCFSLLTKILLVMYIPVSDPVLHWVMQKSVAQLKAGVYCFAPDLVPNLMVSISEEIGCSSFGKQPLIAEAKGDLGSCAVLIWSHRHQWSTCCHSAPYSILSPRYSLNQTNERIFQIIDWRSHLIMCLLYCAAGQPCFYHWGCLYEWLVLHTRAFQWHTNPLELVRAA